MKRRFLTVLAMVCVGAVAVSAQEDSAATSAPAVSEQTQQLKDKLAGLEENYLTTKATVDKLAKIKISGYIQTQIRYAPDTTGQLKSDYSNNYGIGEFQGGNLPNATQSVFQVRRARVKVAYENDLTMGVLQIDALPFTTANVIEKASFDSAGNTKYDSVSWAAIKKDAKVATTNKAMLAGGGVTVKDAYLRFTDPWLRSISLKGGIFDRPFGYEISYSSSSRESPERSRIFQTLFPGERDLGVSLEYLPSDNIPQIAQYFNFKGGLFAGNGINIEFDDLRDVIGRLGFSVPLTDINLGIDGGVSGYFGKVRDRNDSLFTFSAGTRSFATGKKWQDIDRQYMGGDLELYYGDIPVLGGVSLRGEYIQGQQPGTSSTSGSFKSDLTSSGALYLRNFSGFYGMLVLNIDPIKCQLVGKYDSYDPNIDVEGSQVTATSDIKYTTIGGGLVYHWDENIKMTAYYDMVSNESGTGLTGSSALYNSELNDNIFTFRIQYKY